MSRWQVENEPQITNWLPILNSFLLFLLLIGFIILASGFYSHQTFDQKQVIKNQHIDTHWIALNSTFSLKRDFSHEKFALICCRKGDHFRCVNAEFRGENVIVPHVLRGYSCVLHFPR